MIIIGGPTASGKTAVAAAVAKALNGEIVSADSMQVYKGMDIGTAKTSDAELGVRQHMVDVVEPFENFTVVDYRERAEEVIKDIEKRRKLPVVAGGTGFYITSLISECGYGNQSDPQIQAQLRGDLERLGAESLHKRLKELDPVSADKIHYNNTKRLIRALEVCLATGKPFSDQQNIRYNPVSPYIMFVISPERAQLYNNIEKRLDSMFEMGLEAEVRGLIEEKNLDFSMQSMQGIGYKEWKPYFEGECGIYDVFEAIKKNTKVYAKRQQTWFKHQYQNPIFISGTAGQMAEAIINYYKNTNF